MRRRASVAVFVVTVFSGCAGPGAPTARPPFASEASSLVRARPALGEADDPSLAAFDATSEDRIRRVDAWVQAAALEHALEPSLVQAVIWVESRFDPRARSGAGARGLMQLMPSTAAALARRMGRPRASSFDPQFNIAAGTLYLARLRTYYDGDLRLALAAYNAGAGNVDTWIRREGLPPRSQQYIARVLAAKARFEAWTPVPANTRLARATAEIPPAKAPPEPRPARAPAPPLVVYPDADVRFDLDRVESNYVPRVAPEPPLFDTPYPDESSPRRNRKSPVPGDRPRARVSDHPVESPRIGAGVLPSVLD